jgi:hypothetical protein
MTEEEFKKPKLSPEVLKDILKQENPRVKDLFLSEEDFKGLADPLYEIGGKEQTKKRELFRECYSTLIDILKEYVDMRDEYYSLVACWIVGTYQHDNFLTYPYLYFNAMKGSGKTRLLSLIAHLSNRGKLVANMSESVLFRTAQGATICIDEFERIKGKEKANLRELLNAAYKKGIGVERAKKVITNKGEDFVVERFEVFTPVAMANISGMDDVLGDRSIKLTLERTSNPLISRKLEIWGMDDRILKIKPLLVSCSVVTCCNNNVYRTYNRILNTNIDIYKHNTSLHLTTPNPTKEEIIINKILKTEIMGRHLELFFPLFLVADMCGELDKIIDISQTIIKEKKEEDVYENRDVSLIDFISQKLDTSEWIPLRTILHEFKEFIQAEDDKWLNSQWIGVALGRLNLIKDRRRVNRGSEVILDVLKAQEKIKIFK